MFLIWFMWDSLALIASLNMVLSRRKVPRRPRPELNPAAAAASRGENKLDLSVNKQVGPLMSR